jgi:hypothetical protein
MRDSTELASRLHKECLKKRPEGIPNMITEPK